MKSLQNLIVDLFTQLSQISNERSSEILIKRFGLSLQFKEKLTLEEIGRHYNLTRERIRQIEDEGLKKIKGLPSTNFSEQILRSVKDFFAEHGDIVSNQTIRKIFPEDVDRNFFIFFLGLHDEFTFLNETSDSFGSWTIDVCRVEKIIKALRALDLFIDEDDLLTQEKIISIFSKLLKLDDYLGDDTSSLSDEVVLEWLDLSKLISKNCLGEWGKVSSPLVKQKSVADWSFYILMKSKKPMHFRDIAKEITSKTKEVVIVGSCHNQLIADERFVLIGRGIYALKIWGYEKGSVSDVIKEILEAKYVLSEKILIEEVLKKRQVQEKTIVAYINRGKDLFEKDSKGQIRIKQDK